MNLQAIFKRRPKHATTAKNLTPEKLGLAIGLDEFVASTRINRYEKGNHQPDLNTLQKIAEVLEVPPAFFFSDDEFSVKILDLYKNN